MNNKIINKDCFEVMRDMIHSNTFVDAIITSPPYNTNKKAGKKGTLNTVDVGSGFYSHVRYDSHIDKMTDSEYNSFTVNLFKHFDKILNTNGMVLYNLSYGSENTDGMFLAINEVITKTNFKIADVITWKKKNAMPNNMSRNKLTRIVEYIFVFVRDSEFMSFNSNKKVVSVRSNGQRMYENVYNFIEARNNDEPCPYNKATFSSELIDQLIDIYIKKGETVFDPFIGSGTTAISCINKGVNYIGSEISGKQCDWARERISKHRKNIDEKAAASMTILNRK